jgi:hypothetical protein
LDVVTTNDRAKMVRGDRWKYALDIGRILRVEHRDSPPRKRALAKVEQGVLEESVLRGWLKGALTRADDRALFGL